MKNSRASSLTGPDYLKLPKFTRFDELFKFYAKKYRIADWRWLKATATIESDLGDAASVKRGIIAPLDVEGSKSSDGKSWGVMQTILPTARDMVSGVNVDDLNDPETSIMIGAKYWGWLLSRYKGDVQKSVKAYNQGPGNTDKGMPYADGYYLKWVSAFNSIASKQGA